MTQALRHHAEWKRRIARPIRGGGADAADSEERGIWVRRDQVSNGGKGGQAPLHRTGRGLHDEAYCIAWPRLASPGVHCTTPRPRLASASTRQPAKPGVAKRKHAAVAAEGLACAAALPRRQVQGHAAPRRPHRVGSSRGNRRAVAMPARLQWTPSTRRRAATADTPR